jgi:hypothetical protein
MPDVADEELAKGLRDARKKPRYFAAIIKGTSVLKLVVRKKVIKPAESVVQLIDGEHVFQSLEEPPEIKLQPLKDYISEQTELKLKPRFDVVKSLSEVDGSDDGPSPLSPEDPSGQVPTTQPTSSPQDEAPRDSEGKHKWQAAFAALEPRYLAVLNKCPEAIAGKLRVIFTYATEQAEAGAFDKALAAMKRLLPLLDDAERGPAPETSSRLVETRAFLITRFQKIREELKAELAALQAAIAENEADENPEELIAAMQIWLDSLLEQLQDAINASISAGDDYRQAQRVIQGLITDVDDDELIQHLVEGPLVAGGQFADAITAGLDEIASELSSQTAT